MMPSTNFVEKSHGELGTAPLGPLPAEHNQTFSILETDRNETLVCGTHCPTASESRVAKEPLWKRKA